MIQEFNYEVQITAWEATTGEMVTSSAREAALRAIATDFSSTATAEGISQGDALIVAQAIRDAGYFSVKSQGVIAKSSSGEVRFAWADATQFAKVANTLKPELVSFQIERLPTITVVVDPAPPVDYLIEINGERVRAIDKGRYRVDKGDVVVRVTRASRQDCFWRGTLQAGDEQQVTCKL
ncbi:hypothetical protein [Ciceribacter sp. RN22]|uniref:hypothetical protein n=1 Tax=Ciceribacter sp. RN22 TaxID=2954932 RepID=UPI002092156E|nr:hypothetical protein [Ciceribacter sp. RN22]MCO6177464.1 hypothetical protein [Ciceribacter sp. RN22]